MVSLFDDKWGYVAWLSYLISFETQLYLGTRASFRDIWCIEHSKCILLVFLINEHSLALDCQIDWKWPKYILVLSCTRLYHCQTKHLLVLLSLHFRHDVTNFSFKHFRPQQSRRRQKSLDWVSLIRLGKQTNNAQEIRLHPQITCKFTKNLTVFPIVLRWFSWQSDTPLHIRSMSPSSHLHTP